MITDIFFNSGLRKYKNIFTKIFNLAVNYSFNPLSDKSILIKNLNDNYVNIIQIAKTINHPYEEYFNVYMPSKIKISICESLLIITNVLELTFDNYRIDKITMINIINQCKIDVTQEKGKQFLKEILSK